MGKIFDAMEKSKKKVQASIEAEETPDNRTIHYPEKKQAPLEEAVPVDHARASSIELSEAPANFESDLPEKHIAAVDEKETLYDDNKIDKNLVALLNPQSFAAPKIR